MLAPGSGVGATGRSYGVIAVEMDDARCVPRSSLDGARMVAVANGLHSFDTRRRVSPRPGLEPCRHRRAGLLSHLLVVFGPFPDILSFVALTVKVRVVLAPCKSLGGFEKALPR